MLIWGSSFTVTKLVVSEVPPAYFACMRFAVASVILLTVAFLRRKKLALASKPPPGIMVLMGLSGVTFYYTFFNYSLRYTSASTGALLQGFIPVIIAVMAAVFLKETLNKRQVAGILISVTGIAIVGFIGAPASTAANPLVGNLLMLVCLVSWSIYTILSKKVANEDPLLVVTAVTIAGTLFLIPVLLVESYHQPLPFLSFSNWMAILYLGTFASALGYVLYSNALKYLSATQVGIFLNLDPVLGSGIAVIFLHEKISLLQLGGCVLVVIGIWLSGSKGQ